MKPIFAMTLREGAEAARCSNCPEFTDATYGPEPEVMGMIFGALVGLLVMIGIAILFAVCVKKKVRNKDEFNGVAWGLLNGVLGMGILPTVIAHVSINNEIAKVKNKKYAEYAKQEMRKFFYVYIVCIVIWIFINLVLSAQNFR